MSTIDDTSIDQTFPVAGQDNNRQGFRDNFSTIKNNFTITKTHIAEVTTNYARKNTANKLVNNYLSTISKIPKLGFPNRKSIRLN